MSTIKKHVEVNNDRSFTGSSGKDPDQPFFSGRNKVVDTFFAPANIQPKLEIGQPGDKYEQQADRVADSVVQRKCTECEKEESLQKKENGSVESRSTAGEQISSSLQSSRGSGSRLPESIQSEMSQKIGVDFGNVSIHTDSKAMQLNRSLGARAFTHGSDIYLNSGEYNPGSWGGKHLLAHELTHVLQQNVHNAQANIIQKEDESVPSPDPEAEEDENEFEFNFEALPPAIQFTIGNWMLEANTGSAELQFTRNLFDYSFGYSFGSEIFAGVEGPGMSSRLGVNPTTGATSLGFSRDQFRFGGSLNPAEGSVGANVGYGASLLPMSSALQESVYGGWTGVTSILQGLGSMQDPISFYQSYSGDIDSVMNAVRAVQSVQEGEGERFGAGLRFTYNPQTGALISGGMQWFF